VAQAWGLSAQEARCELKKLVFILTKNDHGLTIWKKQGEDEMDSNQYSEVRSDGLDRNGC
jgi:hypothetical protein